MKQILIVSTLLLLATGCEIEIDRSGQPSASPQIDYNYSPALLTPVVGDYVSAIKPPLEIYKTSESTAPEDIIGFLDDQKKAYVVSTDQDKLKVDVFKKNELPIQGWVTASKVQVELY